MSALAYVIKPSSRPGYFRVCWSLPPAGNRLSGSWVERVVPRAQAERFAQRHNLNMPEAA
jgi:hypothetical protein